MTDTETKQQTIAEFIAAHGLTMTYQRLAARTDRAADNFDKSAFHYLVTIHKGEESYPFPYSMGSGHVEKIPLEKLTFGQRSEAGIRTRKDWENVPPPGVKRTTMWQESASKVIWKPKPPELADVLDCLASDCSGYAGARHFEDFASEFGYDTDSRKAERIYDACRDTYRAMENLLGRAALETLMYNVERR